MKPPANDRKSINYDHNFFKIEDETEKPKVRESILKPMVMRLKDKRSEMQRTLRLRRVIKQTVSPFLDEMRLLEFICVNSTEQVERLLKSGVSPNSTDLHSRSALHIAVTRGYVDIVRLLLQYGANPNKKDVLQNTPLHLAACTHHLPIITLLVNAGADVCSLNERGRNPLQLAHGKLQILHRIWRQGAIEMGTLREELKQIVDMLQALWVQKSQQKSSDEPNASSVNELQIMTLSLNSSTEEEVDNQMSKLLSELEQVKIS